MYKVSVTADALADIEQAFEYYESSLAGLGDKFRLALKQRLNDLQQHPQHYGFINEDPGLAFRDVLLRRFPYRVVYRIQKEMVVVIAVYHSSLDPQKLIKRIKG